MKYKQEYLKLKKQLAEETKERQKYEGWWHQETDEVSVQKEKVSKLEEKLKDLETSKLKVEVDLLRKVVYLHERQPSASEVNYVDSRIQNNRWSSANTPNMATSSSTTYI
tara:strand:- start:2158 stop:2487 length:330 start_codon:yes stop_codon:yes gene_type:complete